MLENLFYHILFFSFLLPPLLFLILYKKTGRDIKVLTLIYYCVYTFLVLLFTEKVLTEKEIIYIPSNIRFAIYTLIEYSFFAVLIYQQLKLRRFKRIIIGLSILFLLFQIVYFIGHNKDILNSAPVFLQDFIAWSGMLPGKKSGFDSIPIGFEAILIFIFVFFFLYEQLLDVKDVPIYANYFFWISIGLLIYLGGCLFIYIYGNTLTKADLDQYWFFTYVVETIKNLLLTVAVFVYSQNPNNAKIKSNQALPNLDYML